MDHTTALDGSDLAYLLDDVTDGSNIPAGVRQIADGIRALAADATAGRLTRADLMLTLAVLNGSPDATDLTGAFAALIEHLTSPDTNPTVAALRHEQAKTVQHQGELAAHHLNDPGLRDNTAEAIAALDTRERRNNP
jgi:hypothetical protein